MRKREIHIGPVDGYLKYGTWEVNEDTSRVKVVFEVTVHR